MQAAEVFLLITSSVSFFILLFLVKNYRLRFREYTLLRKMVTEKKRELNMAILRKTELLESQQAIEHTIDQGALAVEKGHHLLRNLSYALLDVFGKPQKTGREQKNTEIYNSIRKVNKQINQVAAAILKELPHTMLQPRAKQN